MLGEDTTRKYKSNDVERLILLLVKQDFPNMVDADLANISPHQQRGYLSQVTRFLKLAKLFTYKLDSNEVESDIELEGL